MRSRYGERSSTRTRISWVSAREPRRGGLTGTFVVNGSPTKTEMVDEAKSRTHVQLTTAVVVAVARLPHEAVAISPGGGAAGGRLPHRVEADRTTATARDLSRRDTGSPRCSGRCRHQSGAGSPILLSIILHSTRHSPPTSVLKQDADGHRAASATPRNQRAGAHRTSSAGIFYANAAQISARTFSTSSKSRTRRSSCCTPTASTTSTAPARRRFPGDGRPRPAGSRSCSATWNDDVRRELDRFGITAKIGADHIFDSARDVQWKSFHADLTEGRTRGYGRAARWTPRGSMGRAGR